ncbi:AarF/ABC1/UbiB kinase family protein [Candidatus Cyanaurora vandensis]|uniref:ABC1 kinase family protein n=1 Tax=Candidatus Cyanaurora vandensis TaxID=2714958 RepID=UPI00257F33A0|nr:AarF/ABC1/UbiB kinase family protein [Candidatus Cyanaurora vandensis]
MAPPQTPSSYRWSRENYSPWRRVFDIWSFVLLFLFYRWLDKQAWSYPDKALTEVAQVLRRKQRAVWIRETLLELGPTFIKVGQLFSTRADLFPKEYVEELALLQDAVPAFPYALAIKTIESELGKPVSQLFSYFEPLPIAAASLGQVHRADLATGEKLVIKVQRPGLVKLFEIDLKILRDVATYLQNHPDYGKGREWLPIYDECCRILYQEIDYLNEGRNADTFRRNFRNNTQIHVPKVYWRYSSPKVLALEYAPGIKISNYKALEEAGLDRKALARIGASSYLQQLLEDGFFHADPHPGNLAVRHDGAVIFYDFGMMGEIKPETKIKLMDTFMGIAQKDADKVIDSLTELGAIKPSADRIPIRRSITFMLNNFAERPFEDNSQVSFAHLTDDIYEMAYDQPFRFPATFTFVLRALSTLEGLGKGLDPNFNFMEVAQPFATQMINETANNFASPGGLLNQISQQAAQAANLPRRVEQALDRLDNGELRVRVKASETDRLLRRLNMTTLGLVYAVLAGASLVATVVLYTSTHIVEALLGLLLTGILALALSRVLLRLQRNTPD